MVLLCVSTIALQLSLESNTGLFASTMMDVIEGQHKKQSSPKLVTDDGMVMDVREEQSLKQLFPKLVTDDGISTDVSAEHSQKQKFPRLVTR